MDESVIYVKLLDEPVDVWRPVSAEEMGHLVYKISQANFDPELETWEFLPRDIVRVQAFDGEGGTIFKAVASVSAHDGKS